MLEKVVRPTGTMSCIYCFTIHHFCVVDMSNFYLDVIKDRLYTYRADSVERRAAQTVMYRLLSNLELLIAPVLSFTAEEIWQYMPGDPSLREVSVQLMDFPQAAPELISDELEAKYQRILDVRYEVEGPLKRPGRKRLLAIRWMQGLSCT